jgi:hypothetical protein
MLLRLIAFFFLVGAIGTVGGDAWASFSSGLPFQMRSLEAWWTLASPSTLTWAERAWPGVGAILPYPAPAVLLVLAVISLLPTIFLRQRH